MNSLHFCALKHWLEGGRQTFITRALDSMCPRLLHLISSKIGCEKTAENAKYTNKTNNNACYANSNGVDRYITTAIKYYFAKHKVKKLKNSEKFPQIHYIIYLNNNSNNSYLHNTYINICLNPHYSNAKSVLLIKCSIK